jgi:hypothetical protein
VKDSQVESHRMDCAYRTCVYCYEYYPSEIYDSHLEFCEKNPQKSDYNQYASQLSQGNANNSSGGINNQSSNQNFEQEINFDEDFDFEDEINEFGRYQTDFGGSNIQNQNNNQERLNVGTNRGGISPNNNVNVNVNNGAPWQWDGNPNHSGPFQGQENNNQGHSGGNFPSNMPEGSPPSEMFLGALQQGAQFQNLANTFNRNPNPAFTGNMPPFPNNVNVNSRTNVTITRTSTDSNGNRHTTVTRQGGNGPQGDIFNNQFPGERMPPWMHPNAQQNQPPRISNSNQNQNVRPPQQQQQRVAEQPPHMEGLFDAFGVFNLFGQNPVDPLTRNRQTNVRYMVNGRPVDPRGTERLADFTNFVRVNRYRLFDDGFMELIQSHLSGMEEPSRGMEQSEVDNLPKVKFQKAPIVAIGEEEKCAICMMDFEDQIEIRKLPCKHFYHPQCIDIWLVNNSSCPVCKQDPTNPE